MIRLIIFIFSTLTFTSFSAHSQVTETYNEVGVVIGSSYYIGDLNDKHFLLARPAVGYNYKSNLNRRFSLRGGIVLGELRGSDKLNNVDTAKFNRNLHFKSPLYELSGIVEFNFFPYETGNPRYPFTPFVFTGVSLFNFNPQARKFDTENPFDNDGNQTNNEWLELQPLGTEGQYSSEYPGRRPYQLIQFAIPVGVGFKASLGNNFSMSIEYGLRKTFTDYLDDVGGYYASPAILLMQNEDAANLSDRSNALYEYLANNPGANISNWVGNTMTDEYTLAPKKRANENLWNDWYYFAGLTISYKINSKPKVCQY